MRRSLLAVVLAALLTASASAQGWGTIKGRHVIEGGKPPPAIQLDVNKDQNHCLEKEKLLFSDKYVVSKTGGVRWVVVWIAPTKEGIADHKTPLRIHPSLAAIKDKQVVVDQPCCKFEPHVVVLRKGQELVGKNSSPINHAFRIEGHNGVGENLALAPRSSTTIPAAKWKPHYYHSTLSCGVHPWMQSSLYVFDHPYFAISDEECRFEIRNVPAGKLRILMQHDVGWVHQYDKDKGKGYDGQPITVEEGKTLDLGQITVKLEP
jgi:hypothetical protein